MGKYQLVRRLATGGMAEVFLAKAEGPMGFEKELVVKRILPHLAEDPRFIEMFLAEAKLAARLNHGNVVQIFDFGEQEDSYFIAMEYVEGLNLKALSKRALQRGTPISYPLLARIVSLACEGLAYAHELVDVQSGQPLGFIHRDISTDNILVSMTGGVKVVDFGIAKAANVGHQTESGILKGKLAYMPPEYLMGNPIDLRADVYALGVVLFELIAGRKPFVAETEPLLMQLILHGVPADVRTLRADVPTELVQVIERAIHKDREARYENCRHMQADLERFLFQCGEPVGALQIAELVKLLAAEIEASSQRRRSGELPAAAPNTALSGSRSTRPLKASSAVTRPIENTLVTPPPFEDTTEEDEQLRRLVARARWRLPIAILAGLLILLGAAVLSFSKEAPSPDSDPQASAMQPQGSAPPRSDPASEATPPPSSPQAERAQDAVPIATSQQDSASESSKLKVVSNLPADLWIDEQLVGQTPWERKVVPGRKEIEINGKFNGSRFHKRQIIKLVAGKSRTVSLTVRRLRVQVQGVPADMRVLSIDAQPPESGNWVETYEGWHTLSLVHVPTGKLHPAECLAKVGAKACKVVLNNSNRP